MSFVFNVTCEAEWPEVSFTIVWAALSV